MSEDKNLKPAVLAADAAPAADPKSETAATAKIVETDNSKNGYLAARRAARKEEVKQ